MIEKILAVDEALEPTLPIAGTTGYDVLREVGGVFIDPNGAPALTALVESAGIDYQQMPAMLADLKTAAATETLASELSRLRRSIVAAAGADHPQLPDGGGGAAHPHRRLSQRLPRPGRDTAHRAGRNTVCCTGIGRSAAADRHRVSPRRRAGQRGCSSCAAP